MTSVYKKYNRCLHNGPIEDALNISQQLLYEFPDHIDGYVLKSRALCHLKDYFAAETVLVDFGKKHTNFYCIQDNSDSEIIFEIRLFEARKYILITNQLVADMEEVIKIGGIFWRNHSERILDLLS